MVSITTNRSISAGFVSASGLNTKPHTALMHDMGMQQQYYGGKTMKRLAQIALVGVFLLAVVSTAVAQQALQPVVRLGNFLEVGNDLFMHIIATADMRYNTVENLDFDKRIRDQSLSRSPTSTAQHETENDLLYAELRFGVDFRYQKNLTFQLLFENQSVIRWQPD